MSIKHEPTIQRYEELRKDILAAIANLREFAESLPETTDGLHYGHIGPLDELRERHAESPPPACCVCDGGILEQSSSASAWSNPFKNAKTVCTVLSF